MLTTPMKVEMPFLEELSCLESVSLAFLCISLSKVFGSIVSINELGYFFS